MKLENIYNELKEINEELKVASIKDLLDKMLKEIRKETCYKTTNKTRVNAIMKVASKEESRPALMGYGVFGEYKGITDSYHAILIKEENIPLKLVSTDDELIKKVGRENCIIASYPNLMACLTFDYDKSNELHLDIDDLLTFIKTNKDKKALYKLGDYYYQARYIKNVIDVIGKDSKIYFQGEYKPLYFVNDNNEIGIVLPVKTY